MTAAEKWQVVKEGKGREKERERDRGRERIRFNFINENGCVYLLRSSSNRGYNNFLGEFAKVNER